jgi:hypothetical protein
VLLSPCLRLIRVLALDGGVVARDRVCDLRVRLFGEICRIARTKLSLQGVRYYVIWRERRCARTALALPRSAVLFGAGVLTTAFIISQSVLVEESMSVLEVAVTSSPHCGGSQYPRLHPPRVAWAPQSEEAKELTGTIVVVVDGQELPKVCSAGPQTHVISGID